jgi:hypothetical protein
MQAHTPRWQRASRAKKTRERPTTARVGTFNRAQDRSKPGDKDGKTRFPFAPGQLVIPVTREECVPQVG